MYSQFMMHGQKNIKLTVTLLQLYGKCMTIRYHPSY